MVNLAEVSTQDLSDIIVSARLVREKSNQIFNEMFRSQVGALFIGEGRTCFGDRLAAYDRNKSKITDLLKAIDVEFYSRFIKH